ncbi:MDR efflux pump AcrAB transcriptional activator RobA [Martelella alba]|uniref:MDR efflux pump AcrAB transcriptional activator RobA n=1 Tax=Martelella alba TaxID=2590451 RepID=A0ABY2SK08_9HYPH|nr:MDR efflux pump AcrAB transcriptional activator RobA [Martelella alba]TKI05611.1 MDR efflux pump AcrAB transcriptional activator RobA [Martelella alba]
MDQTEIIRGVLSWIEKSLNLPLSLDDVAAKSGYSKWHLQRMFKEATGQAMGAYIRARKLSQASVALRLTSLPILDIALQYHFDSQQTFTRAFRRQFATTPARYRRLEEWDTTTICPPILLDSPPLPSPRFITLQPMKLMGVTQSYTCNLEQVGYYRAKFRLRFWSQYIRQAGFIPPVLYGLHHIRPSHSKEDEQEVFYTTAVDYAQMRGNFIYGQLMELEGGDYAQFTFDGPTEELQDFIMTLYGTYLPMLGLTRRKGIGIERFCARDLVPSPLQTRMIHCDYFLPVKRNHVK